MQNKNVRTRLNFTIFDNALKFFCLVTIAVYFIEILINGNLNLSTAYQIRSGQAQALLYGDASGSSLWFKIGFLTYPASYIYLVKEIVCVKRIKLARIIVFGLLPAVLAGLALGGRAQIFNVIAYSILAWFVRRNSGLTVERSRRVIRLQAN